MSVQDKIAVVRFTHLCNEFAKLLLKLNDSFTELAHKQGF